MSFFIIIYSTSIGQPNSYSAVLLLKVLAARDEMQWGEAGPPPLLVKIAPDLSKQDLADIAAVMIAYTQVMDCFLIYFTIDELLIFLITSLLAILQVHSLCLRIFQI